MLTFVGLGLFDEKDISLKGIEAIKHADIVYAEFYTSRLMGTNIEKMEKLYGKKVNLLTREDVEQTPIWLKSATNQNVVFLTGGDTMISTTHIDLRLRAIKAGIKTKLIHGASISSAVCGLTGLQNYRFGKAVTVPYPYITSRGNTIISETPYDTVCQNLKQHLHSLVFLDIDKDKGYMTVNCGLKLLMHVDKQKGEDIFQKRLAVGISRAGSENPTVAANYSFDLQHFDFGEPLHIIVIPADLHFIEAEALVKIANAPVEILAVANN